MLSSMFGAFDRSLTFGLTLLAFALVCLANAPTDAAPLAGASTGLDLICHTGNKSDCYPRIFQPTDEFQVVHDDQEIPHGLHVRLNMATGRKEAKINVPGEDDPALAGLPVDSSVVVVDQPEPQAGRPRIPPGAPTYDPAGKVKEPVQGESSDFYKSLAILKKGLDIDQALEMLEDIAHDIYFALKIAEDFHTVRKLFCLANTADIYVSGNPSVISRARLAALTIASTVQNNPKALAEIEKHWSVLEKEMCPSTQHKAAPESLATATFRLVGPQPGDRNDVALAKARVSAISGLLKSPVIRKAFLDNNGMEMLLGVLARKGDGDWEPAQRKVGILVLDNFLDESMGATLGEWPNRRQLSDSLCEKTVDVVDGGCWDWWAKKIAKEHKSDQSHWSVELSRKLQEQRKANEKGRSKKEL